MGILEFEMVKVIFLYAIFAISALYQIILVITLFQKRKTVDFLSAIKRDGKVSKAGIFFFVLMLIITYQALFADRVLFELVELMFIIVGADLGATYLWNKKALSSEKLNIMKEAEEFLVEKATEECESTPKKKEKSKN